MVLPPCRGSRRCRFVVVWVRRYLCVDCRVTCSVLPTGVLLRYTYSIASIVASWLDAVDKPIGRSLGDPEVWARQGVDRLTPQRHRSGRPRWRSLSRWSARIDDWWPGLVVAGETWRQRSGALLAPWVLAGAGLSDVVGRAIDSHAAWGAAM